MSKSILVSVRAFMHATKERLFFALYAMSNFDGKKSFSSIPSQYQDFEDIFQKKNVDILPKHRLYDYSIDLYKRTQPLFGPIYSLL